MSAELSSCCAAPVCVVGDTTQHWECVACGSPCDASADICEMDGTNEDTYGGEHYWHCGRVAALTVDGSRLCLEHAGELGHGPLQEDYGFDPDDGRNPDRKDD